MILVYILKAGSILQIEQKTITYGSGCKPEPPIEDLCVKALFKHEITGNMYKRQGS